MFVMLQQTKLAVACDWSIGSNESQLSQSRAADILGRCTSTNVAQTLNIVHYKATNKYLFTCSTESSLCKTVESSACLTVNVEPMQVILINKYFKDFKIFF